MGRIAILSDIHGNHWALDAVLQEAKAQGISTCLVAGDIIGYYYSTQKVFELLDKFQTYYCRGNHDEMFFEWKEGKYNPAEWEKKYGKSFEVNAQSLTPASIEKLRKLEHPVKIKVDQTQILICHGSPWSITQYIYPNDFEQYVNQLQNYTKHLQLMVLGHTHHQLKEKIDDTWIVNPGSVGQPRAGKITNEVPLNKTQAHWAIYDNQAHSVTLHTTYYDRSELLKEINLNHEQLKYLSDVFHRRQE